MTPAEHAATVRRAIYYPITGAGRDEAEADLAALVALAERATELEAKAEEHRTSLVSQTAYREAAEARATELERERDEWKREADRSKWPKEAAQEYHRLRADEPQLRERAERAETALRQILEARHQETMRAIARAALGETAPRPFHADLDDEDLEILAIDSDPSTDGETAP